MWIALGHIETPPPIVRLVAPAPAGALPAAPQPPAGASGPLVSGPPSTVRGSVFEMPPGLPAFLKKPVTVPVADEASEFAALAYVAKRAGAPFSHTGPDFALADTRVPFGKPVPVYEFLWYVGNSYIPGVVDINGGGAIRAQNRKPG